MDDCHTRTGETLTPPTQGDQRRAFVMVMVMAGNVAIFASALN